MAAEGPLACPHCATRYSLEERFCAECGMPLAYVGKGELEPVTDAHERARKVKPQYTRGEPVKVGFARNQAEAEMVQGMLLEEGIPSMLKRTRGFDVPDYMAGGPRDILVPQAGAEAAREVLEGTELESEQQEIAELRGQAGLQADGSVAPGRLAFWVIVAAVGAFALVAVLYQLTN